MVIRNSATEKGFILSETVVPASAAFLRAKTARFRACRPILGLLATLVIGLYAVAPAKDLPETRYDESQKLPYAIGAPGSAQVLDQSARVPRMKFKRSSYFYSWSSVASVIRLDGVHPLQNDRQPHAPADRSPIVPHHVLRC